MTTRLRGASLEQESTNFEEGVGELSVEEKYVEVKQLIALGKEKGFLLYDEIYEILPEEVTSLPEELDEIYIRFNDLGIDVVEDAEKQLAPPTGKGTMTIDGTIEEKEMDQREEVQADIIAASSGIVDKTNDPVRMYLREMGTVKLLDRQGEVDIAKRIEKGERKVYKALSQNRIILEEILKIHESAKKDTRVIKEMIDLAMPEDEDEIDMAALSAGALTKLADIKLRTTIKDIRAGEEEADQAKQELIVANLRLVVSIAKKYTNRGLQFLDLIQEGNIGLMKAVEKFEYRRGYKFSTYATWWIRQAITRAIADQARTIRIPVHMIETINKLTRTSRALVQELGREPQAEEIAERMDMPVAKVRKIMKIAQEPISLETPIGEEEDSHLGDLDRKSVV